jgi:hypothetical protein
VIFLRGYAKEFIHCSLNRNRWKIQVYLMHGHVFMVSSDSDLSLRSLFLSGPKCHEVAMKTYHGDTFRGTVTPSLVQYGRESQTSSLSSRCPCFTPPWTRLIHIQVYSLLFGNITCSPIPTLKPSNTLTISHYHDSKVLCGYSFLFSDCCPRSWLGYKYYRRWCDVSSHLTCQFCLY